VSGIRFPLILSVGGHAACLALLLLFLSDKPAPVPEQVARGGIQVVFQPALPKSEVAPLPEPTQQPEALPPPIETAPPPPEPAPPVPEVPAIAAEPTPPAPEVPVAASEPTPPPPPPVHKPAVKKPPKPVQRHEDQPQQAYIPTPLPPTQAPPAAIAPPQTASAATPVPAPVPSPEASAGYRALLSAWLESHKRYPEGARQRGEQGRAVLRFNVDRSGRVIDYSVVKSSGYPDLDESIEAMMRGATLPPFPAGMVQPRLEFTVNINYHLER
jgi:periplasmic protein TonB